MIFQAQYDDPDGPMTMRTKNLRSASADVKFDTRRIKSIFMPISHRGRLAPSPTGALHVGNARTFLVAWVAARAAGGTIALRIEDIDGPRVKPEATRELIEDLTWLGLDWDGEPGCGAGGECAARRT
jgi:hypothetical protein